MNQARNIAGYGCLGLTLWLASAVGAGASDALLGPVEDVIKMVGEKGVIARDDATAFKIQEAVVKTLDPHGAILTPDQLDRRQEEEKGVFFGVGLTLTLKNKKVSIVEVAKDGPAAAVGVKTGWIVEKIGDTATEGLELKNVVNLLRGGKGEPVKLTLRSTDEKEPVPREVSVTRSAIQMPVTGMMELWPQQIGYIKVNGLYDQSGVQIAEQLKRWIDEKAVGAIIDVRGANGINVDAVADVAGVLSRTPAPLFAIKDGNNQVVRSVAVKSGTPLTYPLMILVDRYTSGAAEIMAGVLKESKGAMLIGESTAGDRVLREAMPLSSNRWLYVATRRIEIAGLAIKDGEGVPPHVQVTLKPEESILDKKEAKTRDSIKSLKSDDDSSPFSGLSDPEKADKALIARIGDDVVLRRATDILLGLKALGIR